MSKLQISYLINVMLLVFFTQGISQWWVSDNEQDIYNKIEGGYVGIGTNLPTSLLTVKGGNNSLQILSEYDQDNLILGLETIEAITQSKFNITTNGLSGLYKFAINDNSKFSIEENYFGGQNSLRLQGTQQNYLKVMTVDAPNGSSTVTYSDIVTTLPRSAYYFRTNGVSHLVIESNGSIGIGTTNTDPQYRLSVGGKIRSEEIIVETGWSDFVFANDYPLPSLEEVEKHIELNKHLPDIPTAREIAENGVPVGEMQARLLQKIEELTLYVIQQNKRIQQLESQIQLD